MAFFQCGARPADVVRLRRALPRTLSVLTRSTVTSKISSTACRMSVLLARGSATTVYWLNLSDWRVPFSVTRTVLMTANEFILFRNQPLGDGFKGAAREEHLVAAQNLVSVDFRAGGQFHPRDVARSLPQIHIGIVADDQRR